MNLSTKQCQHLKAKAHALKPVVMLGSKGLTDAVVAEVESALTIHELIKVRLAGDEKKGLAEMLAARTNAAVVQIVGHVATLFRENPD